ncbi:unnamed protein product [Orchesella dallaii]|uniref:DAN domain-containing protein n=1 Tax=Orchesella dallaii TaxID=48710 RepID=A0ABP1S688_9HEXA
MAFHQSSVKHSLFGLFVIGCFTVFQADCRAHHKVHNLALYPERHSWCQATPIRQEISHPPECEPTVIDNVVCLGACFSYSVPRAQDYEPIAPYCDKCDKTVTSWTVVTLNCTSESNGETYQLPRNVELIQNCSCVDCNDNSIRQHVESNEEENATLEEDDIPDTIEGNDLHDTHRHQSPQNPDDILRGIPTRHKLQSVVSAESHELSNADLQRMIQENKIPSDDDHDQGDAARRERQRSAAAAVSTAADHDL